MLEILRIGRSDERGVRNRVAQKTSARFLDNVNEGIYWNDERERLKSKWVDVVIILPDGGRER